MNIFGKQRKQNHIFYKTPLLYEYRIDYSHLRYCFDQYFLFSFSKETRPGLLWQALPGENNGGIGLLSFPDKHTTTVPHSYLNSLKQYDFTIWSY